jgi:hypothetical protein
MPTGYMWDMADYVPSLLDAQLTGRGGWKWASDLHTSDFVGGIYAPFLAGDKLLVMDAANAMKEINPTTGAISNVGTIGPVVQNPVMHRDFVYQARSDNALAKQVKFLSGAYTLTDLPATSLKGKYAAVYKDRLLLANATGFESRLAFSPPGDAMTAWDSLSYFNTSLPLSGIAALRSVLLLFHQGSVERIRGAIPPSASDPVGDMFMEPLYDRAGCGDARSIAYWQDNCVFADERGVHFTDGAIVRNLAAQGSILTFWRTLYRNKLTIAADTFLDYYIVTIVRTDGVAVTLVCDLTRRTWVRFTNIKAQAYLHSIGAQEKLWACRSGANRLVSLSEVFFPTFVGVQQDDDGTPVLPVFETPWYRLSEEGRKRTRFAYLSYDVRTTDPAADRSIPMHWRAEYHPEGAAMQRMEEFTTEMNGAAVLALAKLLEVGYITSPHVSDYTIAGTLPETTKYSRYRLPINKNPYGIAFRVRQTGGSHVTRIYDLATEAQADERSRV